jgi:hypothetical protein
MRNPFLPKRFLAACVVATGCVVAAAPAAAEFKAGIAARVVTPDPLLPVSGGMGAPGPATEKRGELETRALVVEQGDTRVAMVSVPYLGFPSVLGNRVRAKVKGIKPENVLIGATHCHSGPDMYAFPADEQGNTPADLNYIEKACNLIAECINEAAGNVRRAGLRVATGEVKGKVAYNYYAEKLFDPRASVLQFIGDDGKPFATLVNYAIHPEVIGDGRGICSPDLIGPFYDRIAELGGGTAIFMNGAQGGMVTADNRTESGDARTWEECLRIGKLFAEEAMRIVAEARTLENPPLYCAARSFTFPIESEGIQFVVKYSPLKYAINADGSVSTQVNLINLGPAQILTIPGEALPNIGCYLKRKMRGEHNLLFGLTNDAFGYILTKEDFNSFRVYDYVTRTSLGEMTGEILTSEALKFIAESPAPQGMKTAAK